MLENNQSAIVVVPLYTAVLSVDEVMALTRTVKMLGHHPFAVICPEGLDLSPLDALLATASPKIERFYPKFFDGVAGYNKLMLSETLYERFLDYDYLLICQTDAFVFSDRLSVWCGRDYDWIGAPWVAANQNIFNRALFRLNNLFRRQKKHDDYLFKVGNGGFSLRRVSTLLKIVREQRDNIAHRLANPDDSCHHVEDRFFSIVAPTLYPELRIPTWQEAVAFCIDRRPHRALAIANGQLPFACHGFNKRNVRKFWQPILVNALQRE